MPCWSVLRYRKTHIRILVTKFHVPASLWRQDGVCTIRARTDILGDHSAEYTYPGSRRHRDPRPHTRRQSDVFVTDDKARSTFVKIDDSPSSRRGNYGRASLTSVGRPICVFPQQLIALLSRRNFELLSKRIRRHGGILLTPQRAKLPNGRPRDSTDWRNRLPPRLDEFVFRFNRRTSRSRGLLFYRLLQQTVMTKPVTYKRIVKAPKKSGN